LVRIEARRFRSDADLAAQTASLEAEIAAATGSPKAARHVGAP
jgi:hypothetical protein